MAAVALMDARSIAATAANNGKLTSAEEYAEAFGDVPEYHFDESPYKARVYYGFGKADTKKELVYGPNIKDWPTLPKLGENVLLKVCSKILDPVTTTDELIPSWGNVLLPVQPSGPGRIHPEPPGSGLCGSHQGCEGSGSGPGSLSRM